MNRLLYLVVILTAIGCSESNDTAPKSSASKNLLEQKATELTSTSEKTDKPKILNRKQAEDLIFALPEMKQFSERIEQLSQGKVHAAIISVKEEHEELNQQAYWPLDVYENHDTHTVRWASFLVRVDGEEILVEDMEDGPISLQEWRKRQIN